jgi:beta-galactosidase
MADRFTRREMIGASALALTVASGAAASASARASPPVRARQRLDRWRFHLGHAADLERDFGFGRNQRTFAKAGAATADAAMAKFDDTSWAQVQVPHDWAVALPFAAPAVPPPKETADAAAAHGFKAIGRDHPANSIGWYRCPIEVSAADKGRRIWLEFDGVFRD